jgi:uncharacterized membrane protein YfcA
MLKDIVLLAVGLIVGAMNAIAGGGMLVGFPVLIAFGIPALFANATANIVTLPGQLTSAFGYRHFLKRVPLRFTLLLIPVVVGAAAGSLSLRHTSPAHFADIVPLLLLFGVGLFTFQPVLHANLHAHVKGVQKGWLPMVLLGIATVPISYYGGYFGAGYGFMMLAFLGFTNMPDTHMMNGMKNVAATFVASTSIVCLYGSGYIHWRIGLVMAIGSTIGGYVGARYAQKLSGPHLRIIIISIGILAVLYLALRQY